MTQSDNFKVNTFFIGAAKSGTTSLYKSLENSDLLTLPFEKEPNYFNTGSSNVPGSGPGDTLATINIRDEYSYHKNLLLPKTGNCNIAMDFSVSYLYDDQAAINIKKYNPDSKFILILRNPIDRAWSHYMHLIRDCREHLTFEDALEEEKSRIRSNYEFSWHYYKMGIYSEQLERYLDTFKEESIKVILFEDLIKNPDSTLFDILDFINHPQPHNISLSKDKFNATGQTKSKILAYIINRPSRIRLIARNIIPRKFGSAALNWLRQKNLSKTKILMNDKTRRLLIQNYENEFNRLSKLINRNVDHWKL